jgi:DNA-binding NarL/FixJ family response regulator
MKPEPHHIRKAMNAAALSNPAPASFAATRPQGLTSVAVVEDNVGLRRSLVRLVSRAPGFRCVGSWVDGESALRELPYALPDVVLMDINLPGMSGIECTAALKKQCPQTQVIMVTVYEDTESIFRALKAGACGYLLKRASTQEILGAINDVRQGGAPMTSEIARKVVAAFQEPAGDPATTATLSAREQEILELLSQGFVNKEIASRLDISYQTVKVHMKHIYEKLHVRSRTEALIKFMGDKSGHPPGPATTLHRPS